ncbi:class I SAM-dependent methyltransferase [Actinomadura sp. SCN-SB]|uniref:class I SAM-dependent methyltransferase n=1 Tax=Actinomadura sp. SCN-SB TaxID=3373092 RepID=UPI0037532269
MRPAPRLGDTARERILRLLAEPPPEQDGSASYLDLLPPERPATDTPAQRLMESAFLPRIYERIWRPIGFNLMKGWPVGPDTGEEHALARSWLALDRSPPPDAVVLDVACGPGNVTRALASGVDEKGGLVVGLDVAAGMLARAAADTSMPQVGFVRGDATDLPFRDGTFDAVSCFGALYLFDDPWGALDSMIRVLRPGGRIAILTSRRPSVPLTRTAGGALHRLVGLRLFGDREITRFLDGRGLTQIRQRRYPAMQLVGARKPDA